MLKAFSSKLILNKSFYKNIIFVFILFIIAILASLIIGYFTKFSFSKWGFSDSSVYFASAQNFANGLGLGLVNPDGVFNRLTIFPPFYSFTLGILVKLGLNIFVAARLIDVVTFGLFIFVIGFLFYIITSSPSLSLAFSILTLVNFELIINFTSLLSEPIAFLFGFSGFLLSILLIKQKKFLFLFLSGTLCALGLLTRYAFIAFPIASFIIISFFLDEKFIKKIFTLFVYLVFSIGPFALWSVIGYGDSISMAGRSYFIEGSIIDKVTFVITEYYEIIKYWVPYRSYMIFDIRTQFLTPILIVVIISIILIGVFLAIKNYRNSVDQNKMAIVLTIGFLILAITYFFILIFSNTFTNMSAINGRILSPLLPTFFGFLLCCLLLLKNFSKIHPSIIYSLCFIFVFLFVKFNFPLIQNYFVKNANKDNEPTPVWVDKPIFEKIRNMNFNNSDMVFSNGPDIVLYYTAKYPFYISNDMVSEGIDTTVINDQSNLINCQIYILFPTDFIDPLQRQENPLTKISVIKLINSNNVLYSSTDGTIVYNDYCPGLHVLN